MHIRGYGYIRSGEHAVVGEDHREGQGHVDQEFIRKVVHLPEKYSSVEKLLENTASFVSRRDSRSIDPAAITDPAAASRMPV